MNAAEEGRLLGAIGRFASATIAFDVDEHGHSRHFAVRSASADVWGPEAIALVSQWQFRPATKNGQPVQAQCVLDLIVWGPRVLPADSLTQSQLACRSRFRQRAALIGACGSGSTLS